MEVKPNEQPNPQEAQVAKQEIQKVSVGNLFGVSNVPNHSHNGVDSGRIDPTNLLGFPIFLVASASTSPTDTPIDGTIRFLYDASSGYVLWSRVNKTWVAISLGTTVSSLYELVANKSTTTTLGSSNTLYPTQNAVKTYVDNNINTKNYVFTKLSDNTTQNVIAHGLGRTPRMVRFTMISSVGGKVVSVGTSDGSINTSIYVQADSTGTGIDTSHCIHYESTGTVGTNQAQVTLDATNITISWSKTGTPVSGDTQTLWEAY